MSESLQRLQDTYTSLLKDLMSMSVDVLRKSDSYLKNIQDLDSISIDKTTISIRTLLEKINKNVDTFLSTLNTAADTYKSDDEKSEINEKLSLSLKKKVRPLSETESEVDEKPEEAKDNTPEKNNDSDADSDKTIQYFDIETTKIEDEKECSNILNSSQNLKEKIKESLSSDSISFDFDDDIKEEARSEPNSMEQNQRENNELLDLLTKAMDKEESVTEDDADFALKLLENEIDFSSDTDSDESNFSVILSDKESVSSDEEMEEEESEYEPEVEIKEIFVNIKRIDELSEAAIGRLCDVNNINKRKCIKELKRFKKSKRRRIRLLSSTSSSSSDCSITPDFVKETTPENFRSQLSDNQELENFAALVDDCINNLDKENNSEISDSFDWESEPSKPKKTKKEKTVEKSIDRVKVEKKRGKWRDEIFLGTSSDSSDNESDLVLYEPTEAIKNNKKISETTVISDSDGSDSDEVTFVNETINIGGGFKGRKNIRSIISDDDVSELTQKAKTEEEERISRLEEHSKILETVQSQHDDLVLDIDETTGNPLIVVDYNLTKILKPHQKKGVIFMWQTCYESVKVLKTNQGTGCILAHCMGLGKTLQVIALIHTLFSYPITQTKHVLVVCPLSMVINWRNEITKRLKSVRQSTQFKRYYIIKGDIQQKIDKVKFWRKEGGVLVMGYQTFQILTNDKSERVTPEQKSTLLNALINPGPDLIVCDEGHQLKNGKTLITTALMKVKTKRRIVLTGTPLQNNLQEYYYMVQFVKPHILGTFREYMNRFAAPITNGQYFDSTPEDIKLMKKRTHVLTKRLKNIIHVSFDFTKKKSKNLVRSCITIENYINLGEFQRVESDILSSYLPEITDYTIFVKLSPLQKKIYTYYVNMVTGESTNLQERAFLHDVMLLGLISLHPYTLQLYYNKPKPKKRIKKPLDMAVNDIEVETIDDVNHIRKDWFKSVIPEDIATNIEYSSKLTLILNIINQAVQMNEKILVFAHYLVELDTVEHFLKLKTNWRQNQNYYRMDGETAVVTRDELCRSFNTNPSINVFLLTHKVGGLGLNLTGANRVIMIGSNHNPSIENQSMYRVYRFGQTKPCFVYRLLSLATMEEKIYNRCVVKLHLSGTVVDKLHFARHFRSTDLQEMYKIDFSEYEKERPIPVVPSDLLLAMQLQNSNIYKYYLHSSLLENRPEEELTDEDKKLAWDEFKKMEETENRLLNTHSHTSFAPANLPSYGRFYGSDVPNIVPNPLNISARGFIPRLSVDNIGNYNIPQNFNVQSVNFNNHATTSNYNFASSVRQAIFNTWQSTNYQNNNNNNRRRDETPSGEFNYALNKVI